VLTSTTKSYASAALAAALWLAFTASTAFSISVGHRASVGGALWSATGFLAAGLIMLQGPWRLMFAAACAAAMVAVGLGFGESLAETLLFAAASLAVGLMAALLALRFCGVRARRLGLMRLVRLVVFAVIPATACGAFLAGAASTLLFGRGFVGVWESWMLAGGLELAVVLPAVLLAARFAQYREFHRSLFETAGLAVGLALLTAAVFYQSQFPLLFVLYPMVTLIAFRLGPPGAALAALLIGAIALPLTLLDMGPAAIAPGLGAADRLNLIQAFVLVCLYTGVATAGALADQSRLRRLLFWRDRAARVARARAHQAERRAQPVPHAAPVVRRRAGG
jgi:hypothetical protein